MFFVLRCMFWLSIVYASISWPVGAFDDVRTRAMTAGPLMRAAMAPTDHVVAVAAELCARHASDCAAEAGRMTSLLIHEAPPSETAPEAEEYRKAAPQPVRDPRRHGHDARLARAP